MRLEHCPSPRAVRSEGAATHGHRRPKLRSTPRRSNVRAPTFPLSGAPRIGKFAWIHQRASRASPTVIGAAHMLRSIDVAVDPILVPGSDPRCYRVVRIGKFAVEPPELVVGRHVLVIDDVWTTGSNAQSAALTLRHAGAVAVSVFVVGRWLSPRNPLTKKFIRSRLGAPNDPDVCPVTGGTCPPLLRTA